MSTKIAIIGAGASGMMAAITASKNTHNLITVFEANDRVGKKILSTGNGKCNFTNLNMSSEYYYCDDKDFVENALKRFGCNELINFFRERGMLILNKNGYCYPYSQQASTVLDILRMGLDKPNIEVITNAKVSRIRVCDDKYIVSADQEYKFDKVVVAVGSPASTKNTQTGLEILNGLDIRFEKFLPALTQIECEGFNFPAVKGVRSDATVSVYVDDKQYSKSTGELLFTDSGISGIVSFQLSRICSKALAEHRNVKVLVDLAPEFDTESLIQFAKDKLDKFTGQTVDEFMIGLVNKKLNVELMRLAGIKPTDSVKDLSADKIVKLVSLIKNLKFNVSSTRGFESSQVCAGGVCIDELNSNFESVKHKNLFFSGEITNVDGICGGYNLQWAFTSGHIIGEHL